MPRIRTLVIDDEPLARRRVRRLLSLDHEIEVIGECGNGDDAVETIVSQQPDLVFLDVQMPGADGFEVLGRLDERKMPVVVFVTAYDQYALKAFEVHAQDYLLKPFDRARFAKALAGAKEQVTRRNATDPQRLATLLEEIRQPRKHAQRLVVKTGGKILFLKTEDIDWIEAADNYVRLHLGAEAHLLRETMANLEEQLDPERFLRIHRSSIVNVDRIEQLQPWFRGDYLVMLRGGVKLTLSRGYRDRVQALVGRGL